jgi:hypothetical protein
MYMGVTLQISIKLDEWPFDFVEFTFQTIEHLISEFHMQLPRHDHKNITIPQNFAAMADHKQHYNDFMFIL